MGDVVAEANHARYRRGQKQGFYESYFMRANHPTQRLAFWIRYTLYAPSGRPEAARGELWGAFFDGEAGRNVALKKELPFSQASFDNNGFHVSVGDATLDGRGMRGGIDSARGSISWDLRYGGGQPPLLLYPRRLYDLPLPRAKLLVGAPLARWNGTITLGGRTIEIADWIGSQNHNWGTKHTDHYAWGQVAGFDDAPDSFLELATARIKLGPFWTPFMSPVTLRHEGEEIAFRGVRQAIKTRGRFTYFDWRVEGETRHHRIAAHISAPRESFVGLMYHQPDGSEKHVLNSKLAACELDVAWLTAGRVIRQRRLTTAHRAAFEILTDPDFQRHGVEIVA
jgi:hypothetical protein